jgi:hypothetical protein
LKTRRSQIVEAPTYVEDPATRAAIAKAERLASAGDIDGALLLLARVDSLESANPQVPYRIGELLYERGRYDEAAASYLRAIEVDAARALVFFKLGLAFRDAGQRHRAVYAFEQAALRTPGASKLQERCEWEIFKLTFASIKEAGFKDGSGAEGDTSSREAEFATGIGELVWWAQVGSRFVQYIGHFDVRWIDPTGEVVQEKAAKRRGKVWIESVLEFDGTPAPTAGRWRVELVLRDDVVDQRSVMLRPTPSP